MTPHQLMNEAVKNSLNIAVILATVLPLAASAIYLSKKGKRKALRKTKWQLLKAMYSSKKIRVSKGLWIFTFITLLFLILLGVTIYPLWVGIIAFIAMCVFFFSTAIK